MNVCVANSESETLGKLAVKCTVSCAVRSVPVSPGVTNWPSVASPQQ